MRVRARKKNTNTADGERLWAGAKTRSAGSRTGSRGKAIKEIERLLVAEKWKEAQPLLHKELLHSPTDHWLWMMLSETYYEEFDYETALECAKRAVELAPQCPLALWHYAGCLSMNGQERAALAAWTLILNRDLDDVAYGECGEGMKWAMQLLNDVHYRMGRIHQFLGEGAQAKASYQKYLHNRSHGVGSLYELKEARRHLAEVSD